MIYKRKLKEQIESKNISSTSPRWFDPKWLIAMDPTVDAKRLQSLAQEASALLLERIAEHPNSSRGLLKKLSCHHNAEIRAAVTENANIAETLVLTLSEDQHPDVRYRIAENAKSPLKALEMLVNDENPYVAHRAKKTLDRIKGKFFTPIASTPEAGTGLFVSMRDTPEREGHENEVRHLMPFGLMAKKRAESVQVSDIAKLSILVIEDNPADTKLLQKSLSKWPFELTCVDRLSTGLEHLSKTPADVILLDLSLPDAQGIETFYLVHCQAPHIPVVVLTGLEDESVGNEAVQLGAQDYLVKGQVTPGLLARAIKYAVERHESEKRIKELNESLERRILQLAAANQDLEQMTEAMATSSAQARDLLDRLAMAMYKEETPPPEFKKPHQEKTLAEKLAPKHTAEVRIRKNK